MLGPGMEDRIGSDMQNRLIIALYISSYKKHAYVSISVHTLIGLLLNIQPSHLDLEIVFPFFVFQLIREPPT